MNASNRITADHDRRKLYIFLAIAALGFGLASSLRAPNLWSVTHLLFDYEFGLTKRGLVGQVLDLLSTTYSYRSLALISCSIFAMWTGLLFFLVARVGRSSADIWLVLAGYWVSGGFLFQAHTVGYLDHMGLLICLLCFLLPVGAMGMVVRIALSTLLIFVHEGLFFSVFPIIFFAAFLRILLKPPSERGLLFSMQAALAIIVVATTYFLGNLTLEESQRGAVMQHLADKAADFQVREDSAQVLFRDGQDNRNIMQAKSGNGETLGPFRVAVLGIAPYVAALFAMMVRVSRDLFPDRRTRLAVLIAGFSCALAPMLVTIFAWDFFRFAGQVQTSSTFVFIAMCSAAAYMGKQVRLSPGLLVFFVAAVFFGAMAEPQFFDGAEMRRPPFWDVVQYLASVISGQANLFTIPAQ